MCNNS